MYWRVRAVFCGIAVILTVGACTLTTDLDGYAGPAVVGPQDAGDVVISDARSSTDARAEGALPLPPSDAYRALVLSDSPVGYWRLDDTGSVAKDEVGGHDGAYMGNAQRADGILGSSATSFDGTSFVKIGDVFGFAGNAAFTIEAWTSPATTGTGNASCMLAKDTPNDAGSVEDGWAFYLGNSNELIGARWSGGKQEYAQATPVVASVFSHLVMTYDGKNIVVFDNGALVGDLTSKQAMTAISASLIIGGSRDGTGCFFHGVVDEVAIYDHALGNDRVVAHYKAGSAP